MTARVTGLANRRLRVFAGGAALALAASALAVAVAPAGPAGASPTPNYHSGSDKATFTVTGVLDHNCLVSVGGDEIWIKPGDKIKFGSSLVGVSVGDAVAGQKLGGLLNKLLQPSQVAGLNVSAKIYSGRTVQHVSVHGGSHTTFPSSAQSRLSAGDHKITWKATGLALVPGLNKSSIPLSSSALKSGASLSWTGTIHVTKSAPRCKLGVSTPRVGISVGPVKVHVPQLNIHAPGHLPNGLPRVPHLGKKTGGNKGGTGRHPSGGSSSGAPAGTLPGPVVMVPALVVPQGQGGGSYGGSGLQLTPDTGSGSGSGGGLHLDSPGGGGATGPVVNLAGDNHKKPVDLASSQPHPSGTLPVILAVLAILALGLVAGVYARIYLLGRKAG